MKKCLKCHQENPTYANFCNHCGASLKTANKIAVDSSYEKNESARKAERRQLTILFCDLVGSTSLSEKMDPEDYRQMILDYQEVAEEIIAKYGGHVGNYLGDGLLVYFGYPKGLEDAPKAAIQAGLGIIDAISKANINWEAIGKPAINIRIGVHTGLVVVDDHLALGETVNIAARIEGLAPQNGLVISSRTFNLIEGWFEVKSTGKHLLKGISEPLEIFQILKESGAKTRLDIAKGRGLSPLVGRKTAFIQLMEKWNQAKKEEGNMVLLHGEAGIGKTRLVDTLEEQVAKEKSFMILKSRCSSYHQNSAFHSIIEMIENRLLDFKSKDNQELKLIKLQRLIQQSSLDFETAMPLFVELLSIETNDFPIPAMSPFAKRQRIMEILTKLIFSFRDNHPLLFIVEDLHWADASTLEWVSLLLNQISSLSVFVLCTTRPGFKSEIPPHSNVNEITLPRLNFEDIKDICNHLTKGKSLPPEIIEQIAAKTEGVPLFIEELTKMILEADLVVEKANNFELSDSTSPLTIPATLQDSLLARLDRLSDVKEIVQIGSVLGREFSSKMLNAILKKAQDELKMSLNKLVDAEILQLELTDDRSDYQFKHALIQDAAYESMLIKHRQQLHLQVANILESQFEGVIKNQPELLAHHYSKAAHHLEAIPHWLKAGQLASKNNATAEAISHLQQGLEIIDLIQNRKERNEMELEFHLILGGTYMVSHGFPHPKVEKTFNRARVIAQSLEVNPKMAFILLNLLSYYFNREDYKTVNEITVYMLKIANNSEHGYWFDLTAHQLLANSHVVQGKFHQANLDFHRVLNIFDPSLNAFPWELAPSGHIEVGAKAWWMICLQILGEVDSAKALADHHLSYKEQYKDSVTLYHVYTFPALYNLEAREWRLAEKIMEEYLPIVKKFGDPVFTLTAEVYYSIAQAFQSIENALDTAIQLIGICFNIGFKAFAVSLSPFIGELYLKTGKFESALLWIDKIRKHVDSTGSHIHTAELLRIKGLALKGLSKSDDEVEKYFLDALNLAKKQSAKLFELRAAYDLAILWQKQGKLQSAKNLLQDIYTWFSDSNVSIDLKEAKIFLDELNEPKK